MHAMVYVLYLDDKGAYECASPLYIQYECVSPLYIQYECTEHADHKFYDNRKVIIQYKESAFTVITIIQIFRRPPWTARNK